MHRFDLRFILVGIALLFQSNVIFGRAPNIVLIVTDDLGFGDVGCYGSEAIPTPNIDRMASQGIRLTRCYAPASTCTPTRYAIMTGEYAWRQKERQTTILDADAPLAIRPGRSTLPEILRSVGYKTSLVGKWHLGIGDGKRRVDFNGHVGPGPLEVGFDEAFYLPATVDRVPCVFIENHATYQLDGNDPLEIGYLQQVGNEPTGKERPDLLKYKADPQHSGTIINGISRIGTMSGGMRARWVDEEITDVIVSRTKKIIGNCHDQPFFLMIGTHDPHVPHAPHSRFVGQSNAGIRGDSIVQTDWLVGAVLAAIDEAGIDKDTLVIVTSDNGPTVFDGYFDGSVESLGDHHPAGPFRGGKYLVYEGGCRVPFIARWPGRIPAGESDAMFALTDIIASLATISGIEALPTDVGRDSVDLSNVLLDPGARSARNQVVLQGVFDTLALIEGDWKYIPANIKSIPDDIGRGANPLDKRFAEAQIIHDELFDLRDDPQETKNVIDQHPEIAIELNNLLGRITAEK